jgi:hypothetical protein
MGYLDDINNQLSALREEQRKVSREMECVVGRNIIGQRQGLAFRAAQIEAEIEVAVKAREDFKAQLKAGIQEAVRAKREQYDARYGGVLEALMQWRNDCRSSAQDTRNSQAQRFFSAKTEARISNILDRIRVL